MGWQSLSAGYAYAGHPYMLIRRNGTWEPLPGARRLMMRWMKRHDTHYNTTLPD